MNVILVGGGKALYFLGLTFLSKRHSVTVVTRNVADCTRLARQIDATIVHGDASDPKILEEAGAREADVVLAATPSDPDNLVICQMARIRFHVPRAVALVNDPDNQSIFQALGVDAISTSLTVASLIEQRAALDQVTNLIPAGEGKVQISEIALNETSPVVGCRLAEIELPRDSLIAVVIRDGETLIPRGTTDLRAGDHVLVVTLSEAHGPALKVLTGQSA
jgi:trk system potassium uptake protein TrkA